jgi:2-polyprenyl-3-methyl-5-hydroxy-6-metoxy-1,4-benzoquinol methylase
LAVSGELTAHTVLRRARNLRLQVDSHNVVQVLRHGQAIDCGSHGLSILDVFNRPRTLAEALDLLKPLISGAQDWMDVTGVIVGLYRSGILKEESTRGEAPALTDGGFADPMTHAIMLNDRGRTSRFIEAIEGVVRPGDVVLDIGTGSGVLAIAAARAGAKHVYAIEAGDMARLARANFEANQVADRVTLLEGWSTQLDVPEPGDVLVSEIIGEVPLGERILEVTVDARDRLLKDSARLIPSRLKVFGVPVAIPPELLGSRTITEEAIERWRSWYGIDFAPLAGAARDTSHTLLLDAETIRELPPLGPPTLLSDLDLRILQEVQAQGEGAVTIQNAGQLNGVVAYFEAELAPFVSLSTDPEHAPRESSWRNPVWFYNDPLSVREKDSLTLSFSYRVPGRPNGVTISRA